MVIKQLFPVMLALALLSATPVMAASATMSIEELATGMADTPDEHKAVASYYRGKAEHARAEAAIHRRMADAFGMGKYTEKQAMKQHCEGLMATFDTQAKQYDALAASHDNIAKQAK